MKKYRFILLYLFLPILGYGQGVTTRILNDKSVIENRDRYQVYSNLKIDSIILPPFDIEKAINENPDPETAFGHKIKVNLGITNAGNWTRLEDGSRIWTLKFILKVRMH